MWNLYSLGETVSTPTIFARVAESKQHKTTEERKRKSIGDVKAQRKRAKRAGQVESAKRRDDYFRHDSGKNAYRKSRNFRW